MIIIVGPTGVGKTDMALEVAKHLSAEVLSADSRQVYQDLSAGTAKPVGRWSKTPQGPRYLVEGVVHHLLDHVSPTESYTAGRFKLEATAVLEELTRRNVPAVIVGGTGLYLRSLVRGLAPLPQADLALRKELSDRAEREGRRALHAELARVDPFAARAIPTNNIQRVIRALEVHKLTGKPLSLLQKEGTQPAPWEFRWFGLRWDPVSYQERLKQRCLGMAEGILAETKNLLTQGIPVEAPAFQSLGYREAIAYGSHRLSRDAFEQEFLKQTRLYAKRQLTWFRSEPGVQWVNVDADATPRAFFKGITSQILSTL